MNIQKADETNAEVMGEIHCKAWRQAYHGIFSKDFLDKDTPEKREEEFRNGITDHGREYYLLENEHTFIGMMKIFVQERNHCEIESIYLLSEFQGKGYGTKALDYMKEKYKGYNISLWTLEKNKKAIWFYEKNNFRLTGRQREIFR